jgi:hypothetical protein
MNPDPICRCGHPQSFHEKSVGRCKHNCGCLAPRFHAKGKGIEVLALVDPGDPPRKAPTYRVACPSCDRIYNTCAYLWELLRRKRCKVCTLNRRKRLVKDNPAPAPPDMPREQEAFAHGKRARYVAGCRCEPCTEANREYARMRDKMNRMGLGDPLVDAKRARAHILRLSKAGIGRNAVSDVSGVARSALQEIRKGRKKKLRKSTLAKILAVKPDIVPPANARLVDAKETWKNIAWLMGEGFTKGAIAQRLGRKTPALQLKRGKVTMKTARAVEALCRSLR